MRGCGRQWVAVGGGRQVRVLEFSLSFYVQPSGEIKVTLTRTPRRQVPRNQTLLACPPVAVHRHCLS